MFVHPKNSPICAGELKLARTERLRLKPPSWEMGRMDMLTRMGTIFTRHWSLLFIIALFGLLSLLPADQVYAHANYDHSDPDANYRFASGQSPDHVQVWFTERVEPSFSRLEIYNTARQRIDQNDSNTSQDQRSMSISLRPNLPDDAYTVVFRNVSADDGHANTGGFSFVIGGAALPSNVALLQELQQQTNNLNVWSVSIRWLNYLGLAALIGSLIFLLTVWQPVSTAISTQVGNELALSDKYIWRATQKVVLWSLFVLLIGWLAFLLYQSSIASASPVWQIFGNGALNSILLKSRFGLLWLVRLGLLALTFISWLFARRELLEEEREDGSLRPWLPALGGIAIALTTTLDSHSAASSLNWLLVPADVIHLTGMGIWFGGLLIFALVVPRALSRLVPGSGDRTRVLAILIPRFTRIALLSVVLLTVTGTLLAVVQLGSFAALFGSDYGRTLVIKLCIFIVLLAFGAFHQRLLGPRVRAFASRDDEAGGAGSLAAGKLQRMFQKSLRNEAIFALLLLLSVGILTSLSPPPPTRANEQLRYQGQMADLSYLLTISPGKSGPNTFSLSLRDAQDQPVTKTQTVFLRFTMEDMDMGVQVLPFAPVPNKPGLYQIDSTQLSMLGHWQVTLIVRRTGFEDAKADFQILLAE